MTPKEYLSQIYKFEMLIKQKQTEKAQLKEFDGVAGIDYTKEKVQTSSKNEAPYISIVEKLIKCEFDINKLIGEFLNLKMKIIGEIQSLANPQHIEILFKKYVEFKRLEVIAVEMNYSYDYIKHVHGYALQAFGEKFLKDNTQ